ncbi:MAG: IS481 family transposase, partial [Thermomicrobia bacterium]|nr:IS481 family transposase [Thermomicrobia bacterium]
MPWQESSMETLRREFVMLAQQEGANIRGLCRRFAISPDTAYTLLARYRQEGDAGLCDRSRRPRSSPTRTDPAMEAAVCAVRVAHPAWGGRKIRRYLLDHGQTAVPAAGTITGILRRHDLLDPAESANHRPWQRFAAAAPNDLWQMDFKGHVALRQGRCHPLTVLDDHSRYSLALEACGDERSGTVRARLVALFRRYGLPWRILADNGSPWGEAAGDYTALTVWLLRLGIAVSHGRPYHPQTQGKEERFHRTLKAEVLGGAPFADLAAAQAAFDRWRLSYNHERPHEALALATPGSRYAPSVRAYPDAVPEIVYGPDDAVRKVQYDGEVHFAGRVFRVGKAFHGERVAMRPMATDGVWGVYFVTQRIAQIDLRDPP